MSNHFGTYVVEIDWDNDGDFLDVGEVVSGDVIAVEFDIGRDVEGQGIGALSPRTLRLVLDNSSRDYSPENSSSPIYPNVTKPNRTIQVRTTAPTAKTLWKGFLTDIRPLIHLDERQVEILAVQRVARLGQRVGGTVSDGVTTDGAVGEVLDALAWPVGDRSLAAGKTLIGTFWADFADGLSVLRQLEETELGVMYQDGQGRFVFNDRHDRLAGAATAWTYTDDPSPTGSKSRYDSLEPLYSTDGVVNKQVAEAVIHQSESGQVLWISETVPIALDAGETRDFETVFDVVPAKTVLFVAGTDFVANTQSDGTGADVSSQVTGSVQAERAESATVRLVNTTQQAVYITFMQVRGDTRREFDRFEQTAEDASSQADYGVRPSPLRPPWLTSEDDAHDYAGHVVAMLKDPQPLYRMTVRAKTADDLTQILTRDISNRVAIENGELGLAAGGDVQFFVERIEHRIDARQRFHEQTLTLRKVGNETLAWVLDNSTLGTDTLLVY